MKIIDNNADSVSKTSVTEGTKAKKKWPKVLSWCLWDAGGASVNAVATTFVFTVYLTSKSFGNGTEATATLTTWMMIAGIVVAFTAPITGQRADRLGRGTLWLGVFSMVCVVTLLAMFFVKPDPAYLTLGCALLALMTVFFEFAAVNYYAMLPRVSTPETVGRISGIGWASGYFGGIILLMFLNFFFISENNLLGLDTSDGMGVRTAMVVAGIWALIMFIPVLIFVPGRKVPGAEKLGRESLVTSYKKLWETVTTLYRKAPHTLYFLFASAIFRDGLTGIFTYGGVLAGVTFGFSAQEVILYAVVANITAGISTSLVGYVDDWIGPKQVMVISLVLMIASSMMMFFLHDQGKIIMWTFGLFLTLWVGPAQSASRSFLTRRIPEGNEGEVFGLYQTTGRSVTPLAPGMFALFLWIGESIYGSGANVQYWGILGINLILLAGLLMLLPIKEKEAHLDHLHG